MNTLLARLVSDALPITPPSCRHARQCLSTAFYGLALLAMLGACTTTTQHVTEVRPVQKNSAPSDMSELRIADSALNSGNVDLATTLYGKIVTANPRSVPGLTGLGDTLYMVGDFTRAAVYYQRALQITPTANDALIGIGRVAIHQRRFDDAIAAYRTVLAQTPDNPLASSGLGVALDLKGDHAAAQEVLRQALKLNPGDPELSINLGLSLTLGGNPRDGANLLLDVTRFPEAPPQARQDLALAYGLLGNTDAAAEILSRDLPKAAVQDNLRYYAILRMHVAKSGSVTPPFPLTLPPMTAATPAGIVPAAVR